VPRPQTSGPLRTPDILRLLLNTAVVDCKFCSRPDGRGSERRI